MNPLLAAGIVLGWALAVTLGASVASVYFHRRAYREAVARKRYATDKLVAQQMSTIDREHMLLILQERYR